MDVFVEGKSGADSATGNSIYKQKWSPENQDKTEVAFLSAMYVPLRYATNATVSSAAPAAVPVEEPTTSSTAPCSSYSFPSSPKTIIWQNPVPQANTFCQPWWLQWKKETVETSKEVASWMSAAIKDLTPNIFEFELPSGQNQERPFHPQGL